MFRMAADPATRHAWLGGYTKQAGILAGTLVVTAHARVNSHRRTIDDLCLEQTLVVKTGSGLLVETASRRISP